MPPMAEPNAMAAIAPGDDELVSVVDGGGDGVDELAGTGYWAV